MIFDIHAHLISDDPARYPYAPLGGELDTSVLDEPITAERLLSMMDGAGVGQAVAVQRAHVYGTDNSYVVDSAAAHPTKLKALAIINPLLEGAADAARHWMRDRGAVGIRLTAPDQSGSLDWIASDAAEAVWRHAADAGKTMRVHVYQWNRVAALEVVAKHADAYPSVPVIIDHLTNVVPVGADQNYGIDDTVRLVAKRQNISTMASTINFAKLAAVRIPSCAVMSAFTNLFGSDRILWGSDAAQSKQPYADMVTMAVESVSELDQQARQAILHDNAVRIYGSL